MKLENLKSFILVSGTILFMSAINLLSNNLIYTILYGISIGLIAGSYLNYQNKQKYICILHILGIICLCLTNIIFFSKFLVALAFSLSLIILLSGTFFILRSYNK